MALCVPISFSLSSALLYFAMVSAVASVESGHVNLQRGKWFRISRWGSLQMSFMLNTSGPVDYLLVQNKLDWKRLGAALEKNESVSTVGGELLDQCLRCTSWTKYDLKLKTHSLYSVVVYEPLTSVHASVDLLYTIDISVLETCWAYMRMHRIWVLFAIVPFWAIVFLMARQATRCFFPTNWQQDLPWDDNPLPRLTKCERPSIPQEPFCRWWRHTWPYSWVCLPWHDDLTTRSQRAFIVVIEVIMTALLSQVYSFTLGFPTSISVADSGDTADPSDPDSLNGWSIIVIGAISSAVNLVVRTLLKAWLKLSCQTFSGTEQPVARILSIAVAALVIVFAAVVPLAVSFSKFSCRRLELILWQTLGTEFTRGLLIVLCLSIPQYILLWKFGSSQLPAPDNQLATASTVQHLTSD